MAKKEEKKKRKKSGVSREPVTKDGGGATKEVIGGGALSKEVLHENLSKEAVGGSCREGLLSKNVEPKRSSRRAVRKTKTAGPKDKKSSKQSKEVIEPPPAVPGSNSSNQSEKGMSSPAKKEEKKETVDVHDTIGRALTINPWYHGMMPRDEIEELLKNDGDFLLRKTEVAHLPRYAISVTNMGRVRHILFVYRQHLWSLRGVKKPTLTELIETHVKDKIPVMADGTLIKVGVARPEFYILHEHVEVKEKLGGGSFGDVYKGVLKGSIGEKATDVAVKKLKKMIKKKQRCEFVREAKVMRRLNHPNIVKIYGVAPQEEPMLIVLELAAGGSLRENLRKNPKITIDHIFKYVQDAARGMCYLSGRNIIHRDVAARNCLLGANDEVKIADFGMALADKSTIKMDKLEKMPVKWLSPETLKSGVFTTKSDVWSFGVLIWEVFSRCKEDPFHGETNHEAKAKILSGKVPLKPPPDTHMFALVVMNLCFVQNAEDRPDFVAIFNLLSPGESPPIDATHEWASYGTK